ncbi:hypothetical protein CEB94_17555 [Streptomyces hawaiiensis]|uniref:Alcohol dehydrogenase-like C-terminal domain-containing protein n=1 Tax=Streptomyces hawaiiensis TaxID=67305 RepID=A0A6G5RFD1_9ACTN|nr:hypothetical protein CEB94_17555 [Streptomyces hawaiiensis]
MPSSESVHRHVLSTHGPARHGGAVVIGTAGPGNHAYLCVLGATPVEYGDGLADRVRQVAPDGVDAALDASGRGSVSALIELTGDRRRGITLADARASDLGVRYVYDEPHGMPGVLGQVAAMAAAGSLTPCQSLAPTS